MLDEVRLEVEEVMEENSNLRSTGDEPLLLITETLAKPLSSDRLEEGLVSIFFKVSVSLLVKKQTNTMIPSSPLESLLLRHYWQMQTFLPKNIVSAAPALFLGLGSSVKRTPAHFLCKHLDTGKIHLFLGIKMRVPNDETFLPGFQPL